NLLRRGGAAEIDHRARGCDGSALLSAIVEIVDAAESIESEFLGSDRRWRGRAKSRTSRGLAINFRALNGAETRQSRQRGGNDNFVTHFHSPCPLGKKGTRRMTPQ